MAHLLQIKKLETFTGHKDCVYSLATSDIENCFFSAAGDGMVVKWNIQKPDEGELMVKVPNSVYAIENIKNQNELLVGQNFSGIHLIDLVKKKETMSLRLTDSYIFDISFVDNLIIVACGNGEVHLVNKLSFQLLQTLNFSGKSARSIAINPVLKEFAVAYSDFKIRVFSLKDFSILNTIEAHTNSVFTLKYSTEGHFLFSGSRDAHLKIWDCWGHYKSYQSVVAHMFAINSIGFSPSGKYFATGSMDKSIKIWSASEIKLLKVLDKSRHAGHGTSVNKVLWLNDSKLATCSDDRTISLWDISV